MGRNLEEDPKEDPQEDPWVGRGGAGGAGGPKWAWRERAVGAGARAAWEAGSNSVWNLMEKKGGSHEGDP